MSKIILTCIFLCVFTTNASAQIDSIPQSTKQQKKALKLAENWVKLVTEGVDLESLITISGLPFALDRSEILNSNDELKSSYLRIFENVGKGPAPKVASEIHDSKYEIIESIIPINVLIIRITMLDGDLKGDEIFLTVHISGDEMKIIGFSD